jgi:pimeloyl-ACP methyl ester carboxylesterase
MVRTGRAVGLVLAVGLLLSACTGDDPAPTQPRSDKAAAPVATTPSYSARPGEPAGLARAYACQGGFTCGRFPVPVDHQSRDGEQIELQIAFESAPEAPRGVLVVLNGGPGAPAAPLIEVLGERFGLEVMAAYRVVAVDTRGTGVRALHCSRLQSGAASDYIVPAELIEDCGENLAEPVAAYGTDDVVRDLDLLRAAFGVDTWTLFAMSYGTFVAQQYAAAHPDRVAAIALDSPMPVTGTDTLQRDVVAAVRRVLADACADQPDCTGDPVADIATVVRRDGNGAELLEFLAAVSGVRPSFDTLLPALRSAADGDQEMLDRLFEGYAAGTTEAAVFSSALNLAAFCADQSFPWGRSDAPDEGRAEAVRQELAGFEAYPFDRASLANGGPIARCLPWPPAEPSDVVLSRGRLDLPDVPVLMLVGDRDLSTPMESARASATADLPRTRVEVVRGAGHITTAQRESARETLRDFLLR